MGVILTTLIDFMEIGGLWTLAFLVPSKAGEGGGLLQLPQSNFAILSFPKIFYDLCSLHVQNLKYIQQNGVTTVP